MNGLIVDPSKTRAVAIGIEKYAIPSTDLNGPARDACRFIRWLRGRGVPAGNIRFFASPLPGENAAQVAEVEATLGVKALPASRDLIYTYLTQELPEGPAELLWLFWGGHGILTGSDERRLIFADATEHDYSNLDLGAVLRGLRDVRYGRLPRQVVVIDACANEDRTVPQAMPFPAATLDPSVAQFVLLGARPGEVARNDNTRRTGVFSDALLDALEVAPAAPFPPDLPALADALIKRFATLRARGEARQTPVTSWYQDWAGGRRQLRGYPVRPNLCNLLLRREVLGILRQQDMPSCVRPTRPT